MPLNAPLLQPFTNITPNSFVTSWTAVADAKEYVLYVARTLAVTEDSEGNEVYTLSNYHSGYNGKLISGLRWEVTNLLPSTTYYVRVDSKSGTLVSNPYRPKLIATQEQPVRKTARGLRVDYALGEYALRGLGDQYTVLNNLLTGVTLLDGLTSTEVAVSAKDVYAIAQKKAYNPITFIQETVVPKASSFLTKTVLYYLKGFKGKVSDTMDRLRSSFSSFNERSSNAIEKTSPNFKNPYGMYGQASAAEFFIKDGVGAEAVPVLSDDVGYWEIGSYSTEDTSLVIRPKRPEFVLGEPESAPNVQMDYLRIGSQFNISVPTSGPNAGIGGDQPRNPSGVTSDTSIMLIVRSVNEPGRLFFVKTERVV